MSAAQTDLYADAIGTGATFTSWACNVPRSVSVADKPRWAGLQNVGVVESRREIKGAIQTERRYFLASLARSVPVPRCQPCRLPGAKPVGFDAGII